MESTKNYIPKEYSDYLNSIKPMSSKELKEVIKKYYETEDDTYFYLIFENLQKLVIKIANDVLNIVPTLDIMDIIQEGNLCLVKAIKEKKFNLDYDIEPSTYFYRAIRNFVGKFLARNTFNLFVRGEAIDKLLAIKKYNSDIQDNNMTQKEALKKNNLKKKDLTKYTLYQMINVDQTVTKEDGKQMNLIDSLDITNNRENPIEKDLELKSFYETLEKIIKNKKDYNIFVKRFIDGYRSIEIAEMFNMEKEEVNRSLANSKKIIKKSKNSIKEFLNKV